MGARNGPPRNGRRGTVGRGFGVATLINATGVTLDYHAPEWVVGGADGWARKGEGGAAHNLVLAPTPFRCAHSIRGGV